MRSVEPRRSCSWVPGAVALLATWVSVSPAHGQPAAVEDLIRKGNDLRTKGEDQYALPLFQKAYDLERSPRTAAQLGLVEAALGYWMSSERHLQEALTSTRNPWLIRYETQIRKTLAHVQASIGEVEVNGSPRGAAVLVNGQPVGQLPLAQPVRIGEGAVQVVLRAPGYKEGSSYSKVAGGQRVTVSVHLEQLPALVPAPPAKSNPERGKTRGQGPVIAQSRAERADGQATWIRPATWIAATTAVVALSVGAYGLHTQRTKGEEFDNYPSGSSTKSCGASRPDRGGPTCRTLYNQAQTGKRLMIGGFAAGGVLATAAIVGFVISSSDGSHGGEAAVASAPTFALDRTSLGFGWSARF
jgi:PEGA domain